MWPSGLDKFISNSWHLNDGGREQLEYQVQLNDKEAKRYSGVSEGIFMTTVLKYESGVGIRDCMNLEQELMAKSFRHSTQAKDLTATSQSCPTAGQTAIIWDMERFMQRMLWLI